MSMRSKAMGDGPSALLTGISRKLQGLEAAVQRQAERFSAVLEIGTLITSARDVDDLLRLVMDRLTGLLGAEASTLFMLDEQKQELWSRVLRGPTPLEIRVPAGSGIVGHVLATGTSLLIGDAYADQRFNREIDRRSGFETRSIIAAPLRHVSGRILGALEVLDRKLDAFTPDDLLLVEAVAAHVAGVLDNVLLYEQLRAQNEQLRVLYDVERAVSDARGQEDLLDQLLAQATSLVGAPAGAILLIEPQGSLVFRSTRGEKSEALIAMQLKDGRGIAGHVARTGQPVRVPDAGASELHDPTISRMLGVDVGALLCVPIPGEDRVLGALELLNKPGGFSEADERLATLLAGQTGRAILLRHAREEGERRGRLEAIGQMLSSVLHDLRTPMTVISGYAQLMAGDPNPEARRHASEMIEKQVDHINAMTRETLAFARGERELLLRPVQMQRFVAEVEEFLLKDLEQTGVALVIQTRYAGLARVDENKLKRVVYNIARNAAQAMPGGGRFTFTVDRQGDELVLTFEDTGPGIPPEIADRLFQSFVTARKEKGTGLGLAIVKKIAEEHGGRVGFRSEPGKGTTFEVRLPAGAPAPRQA